MRAAGSFFSRFLATPEDSDFLRKSRGGGNRTGTPLPGDPGGDDTMDTKDKDNPPVNDTMDYKDKDNPGSGNTDDNPPLLNMINLDGSSANNNPGSGDFNILNQLVSSDTQASRFSTISVTMALLDKPTGKMMNTTTNKDSFGTPPTGDPGGNDMVDDKDKDNPGSGNSDDVPPFLHKVNLDGSSANDNPGSRDFNIPNQLASLDTSASRFSLISVTKALLNKPTGEVMNTTMDKDSFGTLPINDLGNSDLYAGLRWTDVDCAMRSYVHNCGG